MTTYAAVRDHCDAVAYLNYTKVRLAWLKRSMSEEAENIEIVERLISMASWELDRIRERQCSSRAPEAPKDS